MGSDEYRSEHNGAYPITAEGWWICFRCLNRCLSGTETRVFITRLLKKALSGRLHLRKVFVGDVRSGSCFATSWRSSVAIRVCALHRSQVFLRPTVALGMSWKAELLLLESVSDMTNGMAVVICLMGHAGYEGGLGSGGTTVATPRWRLDKPPDHLYGLCPALLHSQHVALR